MSSATAAQQAGDARIATEVAATEARLNQVVTREAAAVNADNGILARSEALSQVLHNDSGADNLAAEAQRLREEVDETVRADRERAAIGERPAHGAPSRSGLGRRVGVT